MRSQSCGQVLVPALGLFIALMILFISLAAWGVRLVKQMRVDMAARACALSAARAQAQVLNTAASHNLMVNAFVNLRFEGVGAMQKEAVQPFRFWLETEDWERRSKNVMNGFLGQPVSAGQVVAHLNGVQSGLRDHVPTRIDPQLALQDLLVIFLYKIIPVGGDLFENVYFVRTWGADRRKAQPPHVITWHVLKGDQCSSASARVYLDIRSEERLQNGGFPRIDETVLGNIEIQSFYPQFNAALIPTRGAAVILERMHRGIS